MLGKLSLAAIPFDVPLVMVASGVVGLALLSVLGWIVLGGHLPYLWARVEITSPSTTSASASCTRCARARHAAARLHRRHHDALATGARLQGAGLPAARAL